MSYWNAKYKNDYGEYEITFASKQKEETKAVEKLCQAIIDKRVKSADDVAIVRHGRWEWFEEWSPSTPESPKECIDCGWRCGRCKVKLDDMVGWYWDDPYDEPKLNYCPNCGMKVDEQN